jgi:hypothetical protein
VPETSQAQLERAPRYRLSLPLKFRREGDDEWREGKVENISSTGVLFVAPEPLEPQTVIEIKLVLSIEFGTMAMGEIACNGQIVRASQTESAEQALIAATLSNYQFASGQFAAAGIGHA